MAILLDRVQNERVFFMVTLGWMCRVQDLLLASMSSRKAMG